MMCVKCGYPKTEITNSRDSLATGQVRRRRLCPKCNSRYSTIEQFIHHDLRKRNTNSSDSVGLL